MKFLLVMTLCCFIALALLSCANQTPIDDESGQSEDVNEAEEVEEALFSQDDFVLRIDTLPYRGAVLFIDYDGEVELSDYALRVDVVIDDSVMQQNMLVEYVDGNLVAEIIDLMYLPGDELNFVLKLREDNSVIFEYHHSEQLQSYPWKDWMLAEGEWFSFGSNNDNFVYGNPSWGGVGAHASWDIWVTHGKAANVYSGTMGIVVDEGQKSGLKIYNPYVGAIVQYGHTKPVEDLYTGKIVMPGEHISNVIPHEGHHIHYSVLRPFGYSFDIQNDDSPRYTPILRTSNPVKIIWSLEFYKDPFYFHEPTTLGYWYEETLPTGLKEEMLKMFHKNNPDVVLPARKPLDSD